MTTSSHINTSTTSQDVKLADTQYVDVQWLQAFGLNAFNVLDYFYTSPFFDKTSNNQVIRSQNADPRLLLDMRGVQYSVDPRATAAINVAPAESDLAPRLFVIRKVRRESPQRVSLLQVYYCLDGVIYQAPVLLHLLRARIAKASLHAREAYELLRLRHQSKECTDKDADTVEARNPSNLNPESRPLKRLRPGTENASFPLPAFDHTLAHLRRST